ncbi:MAG: GerW family sporulation protein [Clostridia bacterium]|nr:GerW family sporulation protein [Clostridia bacterium]
MSNKIEGMMNCSVDKMKEIINADTIIGNSITTPDGTVVIPVSKVTYGFASGGSDFASSNCKDKEMFGGGNGVGVSIIPVAFLVISGSGIKLMQIESFTGALDRIISMTPDMVDKISAMIKKRKEEKKNSKNDKD